MVKGDYRLLKADPDDGTTPCSWLLLEAIAMAKLSGAQKGILLHLARQTYGWTDDNNIRLKEEHITLSEWSVIIGQEKTAVSKIINDLIYHKIIIRKEFAKGKGFIYSINTKINQWNGDCIDHDKLKMIIGVVKNDNGKNYTMVEIYNRGLIKFTNGGGKKLPMGVVKNINKPSIYKRNSIKETPIKETLLKKDGGDGENEMIKGSDKEILDELRKLPTWKETESDISWVNEIITEFPFVSISMIRSCRDWHLTKHPNIKKHNWKSALRNWLMREDNNNVGFKTGAQQQRKAIAGNKSNGGIAALLEISEHYNGTDNK